MEPRRAASTSVEESEARAHLDPLMIGPLTQRSQLVLETMTARDYNPGSYDDPELIRGDTVASMFWAPEEYKARIRGKVEWMPHKKHNKPHFSYSFRYSRCRLGPSKSPNLRGGADGDGDGDRDGKRISMFPPHFWVLIPHVAPTCIARVVKSDGTFPGASHVQAAQIIDADATLVVEDRAAIKACEFASYRRLRDMDVMRVLPAEMHALVHAYKGCTCSLRAALAAHVASCATTQGSLTSLVYECFTVNGVGDVLHRLIGEVHRSSADSAALMPVSECKLPSTLERDCPESALRLSCAPEKESTDVALETHSSSSPPIPPSPNGFLAPSPNGFLAPSPNGFLAPRDPSIAIDARLPEKLDPLPPPTQVVDLAWSKRSFVWCLETSGDALADLQVISRARTEAVRAKMRQKLLCVQRQHLSKSALDLADLLAKINDMFPPHVAAPLCEAVSKAQPNPLPPLALETGEEFELLSEAQRLCIPLPELPKI